jgi:hypothetical protein
MGAGSAPPEAGRGGGRNRALMERRLATFAFAAACAFCAAAPGGAATIPLPAVFEGNAVVLTPQTAANGATVRILADSGGYDLIEPSAVTRLALDSTPLKLGSADRATVAFPAFRSNASFPAPSTRWLVARPNVFATTFALAVDATLGPSWFADRLVQVDYPGRRVAVLDAAPAGATAVPLVVARGRPAAVELPPEMLALVDVAIAGETLTMLLDTGATARIDATLRDRMPDAAPVRQVSFADAALVARWHAAHPDWDYAAAGAQVPEDDGFHSTALIRVPALAVGGRTARPTWFLARPDDNLAQLTKRLGRTISGDLGGDALRAWRVTFDLAHERLLLE